MNRFSNRLPFAFRTFTCRSFAATLLISSALLTVGCGSQSPTVIIPPSTNPSITSLNQPSGTIDTVVTITGTNFGAIEGTSTVQFNGTKAPVKSWSDSNIVVTVPGGATTGSVVVTVAGLTSAGLTFTVQPLPGLPTHLQVVTAIKDVNDFWIANNPVGNSDWASATYYTGDVAAYDATGEAAYLSYAQSWASANSYSLLGGNSTTNADAQAAGQVYIRLYQLNPAASDLAGITQSLNGMVASGLDNEWSWIDALNMSMPNFVELGAMNNNTNYYNTMYSLYHYTKDTLGLYDTATDLWWRDSSYAHSSVRWARGNGWVFAAHAKVLAVLPKSDPHYAEYLTTYLAMAQKLATIQVQPGVQPHGYWNSDLTGTDYAGPETSGTSFFLYGFAWGINNGVLDLSYLPVVQNAWNFLAYTAIQPPSPTCCRLGYVQPPDVAPDPSTASDTANFGVGAFLLAARQMELMTK